ncbi:gliding motility-associated lipoprotein GldK [Elysia marginata]|uniref:Gliding motility-associated lipoprotein GldK n=1 Tax=Elysia marginata TaxID=1093978 RepID=A0AAV4GSF6_9GAST|nr:gliding motility-associated lipoprotein GldK [Elysia marginata]
MSLVPQGTFIVGKSNDDRAGVSTAPTKSVAISSFYMDETEITNNEYRQFIDWVKDSILRVKLAEYASKLEKTSKDKRGIGLYAYVTKDTSKMSGYEKYMSKSYPDFWGKKLDKTVPVTWKPDESPDEYYAEILDSMYLPMEESVDGKRLMAVKNLKYMFNWLDIDAAAKSEVSGRKDFVRKEVVEIYPDTLVWIKDFSYSYNEPLHNEYLSHVAYSEYPVVGVTWHQARAFCAWRSALKNEYQRSVGKPDVSDFRLPTETEWEYAARGGLEGGKYPWGGPYIINDRGCYMANFKPLRGDYASDGNLYTARAKSYESNDYNLFNMSGNVSEWTNSSYYANSYDFVSEINPNTKQAGHDRRVIRGGSWKDVAYFLEVSTRDFEYSDSARSYIGFRTVQDNLEVTRNR